MRAFSWFLAMIVAALASIALFTYPAWLLLHPYFDFPFHRIGDRIGMLALFLGLILVARRLKLADRAALGYGLARGPFLREMALGLALGVTTMLAVVGIMSLLGLLDWTKATTASAAAWGRILGLPLLSGLAVAFIEETFLRGAMFTAIERESGAWVAILTTSFIYSLSHFIASYHIPAEAVSPWSGLEQLQGSFRALGAPLSIADAFLALLAVGIVLAAIRAVTGNIAVCLGLHAGWVWVMLATHETSAPARGASLAFLLSQHDGFVGWLVLGWTVLIGPALVWLAGARKVASSGAHRALSSG
jgi:membrane protease YdiL (CAAX protease family)